MGEPFSYKKVFYPSLFRKLLTIYTPDIYSECFLVDLGNWLSPSSMGYVSELFECFLAYLGIRWDYSTPKSGPSCSSWPGIRGGKSVGLVLSLIIKGWLGFVPPIMWFTHTHMHIESIYPNPGESIQFHTESIHQHHREPIRICSDRKSVV